MNDASRVWDVVVIGAGPAGALAATTAAEAGLTTLLIDRSAFPRFKVCGACVSWRAVKVLRRHGLDELVTGNVAVSLRHFQLHAAGYSARVELPGGVAVARETFDQMLVEAAVSRGASFLPETVAEVVPGPAVDYRQVRLMPRGSLQPGTLHSARVVVVADGLGHPSLKLWPEFACCVEGAKIGLGAVFDDASHNFESGVIYMAAARAGYVGIVRLADGRLNVAAALDSSQIGREGEPVELMGQILAQAGVAVPDLRSADWRGTRTLTRRSPRTAAPRLFLVGDAAGYVEPFTGEGIATALESASAVQPLVQQGVVNWDDALAEQWERLGLTVGIGRQNVCRHLIWWMRFPWAVRLGLQTLAWCPGLADLLVKRINSTALPSANWGQVA
ncbi:MAG: FAD-dependent monooxygenase [Pirellulales bacterium]